MAIRFRQSALFIAAFMGSAHADGMIHRTWNFQKGNISGDWSFENASDELCAQIPLPYGVSLDCHSSQHGSVSGDYALTVSIPAATLASPVAAHKTDFLRVYPGQTYSLSFWYGILLGSVSQFRPQVEYYDESKSLIGSTCEGGAVATDCPDLPYYRNVPLGDLEKWFQYRATLSPPVNTAFIRLSFIVYKQATTWLVGMKFDDLIITPGNSISSVHESRTYMDAGGIPDRIVSGDDNVDVVTYVQYDEQRRPTKEYVPIFFPRANGTDPSAPIVVGTPQAGEALRYGFATVDDAYAYLKDQLATLGENGIQTPVIYHVVNQNEAASLGIPPLEFSTLFDRNGSAVDFDVQGVIRGTSQYQALVTLQGAYPPVVAQPSIPEDPSTLTTQFAMLYPGESNYFKEAKYFRYGVDIGVPTFSIERSAPGNAYALANGHNDKIGWGFSALSYLPTQGNPEQAATETFPNPTEVGYVYNWSHDRQGNYQGAKLSVEGNLLQVGYRMGENWNISDFTYDGFNRLSTKTSPSGLDVSILSYDGLGYPKQIDDPDRGVTGFRYNDRGWLRFTMPPNQNPPPAAQKMVAYKYDRIGRMLETGTTDFNDGANNLEDFSGFPSAHLEAGSIYDELSESDWLSKTGVALATTGMDVTRLKNTAGRTAARYNTNPDFTAPGFGPERRLTACFYSYDSLGRVDTAFHYIGAINGSADRLQKIGYSFDSYGRMDSRTVFSSASGQAAASQTVFKYDGSDRVSEILDKDGREVASYQYDFLDRVQSVKLYGDFLIRYTYSIRGEMSRIEAVTLEEHPKTIYSEYLGYDGKPYDGPGIPELESGFGARYTPKRYDGRISSILRKLSTDASDPIAFLDFKYDDAGRLLRAQARKPVAGGTLNGDGTIDFSALAFPVIPPPLLDNSDPITPNVTSESYEYDPDGTITTRTEFNGFEGQGVPSQNITDLKSFSHQLATHQLKNVSDGHGNGALRKNGSSLYDAAGNFVYDSRGRMTQDKGSGVIYDYGFFTDQPIRVRKTIAGQGIVIHHYLYDENQNRVAEVDELAGQVMSSRAVVFESGNSVIREYLYRSPQNPLGASNIVRSYLIGAGGSLGVQDEATGDTRILIKDHAGNMVKVAAKDANGNLSFQGQSEFTYWSFGLPILKVENGNGIDMPPSYTGKDYDKTLSMYDFGARVYDPELGSWLTPDAVQVYSNPYAFGGGMSSGDPVNYVDPDGNCPICIVVIVIGVIAGAYAGGAAANGDPNPLNWDYSNSDTWAGMGVGGIIGGVSAYGGVAGYGLIAGGSVVGGGAALGAGIGGGVGLGLESYSQAKSGEYSTGGLILSSGAGALVGAASGALIGAGLGAGGSDFSLGNFLAAPTPHLFGATNGLILGGGTAAGGLIGGGIGAYNGSNTAEGILRGGLAGFFTAGAVISAAYTYDYLAGFTARHSIMSPDILTLGGSYNGHSLAVTIGLMDQGLAVAGAAAVAGVNLSFAYLSARGIDHFHEDSQFAERWYDKGMAFKRSCIDPALKGVRKGKKSENPKDRSQPPENVQVNGDCGIFTY